MPYPVSHARLSAGRCAALILALAATGAASPAFAICSCTRMDILHGDDNGLNGQPVMICSANQRLNFVECGRPVAGNPQQNGCAVNTWAYTCPVGVNYERRLRQRTGFATNATLANNADECQSGQAVQLTITSNGGVARNPQVHATPNGDVTVGNYTVTIDNGRQQQIPGIGATTNQNRPLYGADSYTNPNANDQLIQRTADSLKWWDNTDQAKDHGAREAATWEYRFFSYVTGTQGQSSCGCIFDIDVTWPADDAATTTYTLDQNNSINCRF